MGVLECLERVEGAQQAAECGGRCCGRLCRGVVGGCVCVGGQCERVIEAGKGLR